MSAVMPLPSNDAAVERLRVPPHSVQAEQAVLGGLMLAPHTVDDVRDVLDIGDFYRHDHQLIFRAICAMADDGKPFDSVTLADWFDRNQLGEQVAGGAYLIELATSIGSAANIRAYADIVREKADARRLIEIGTDAANAGFDGGDIPAALTDLQARLVELEPKQRGGLMPAADGLKALIADIGRRFEIGDGITGIAMPWAQLNAATHGLQPGELTIIAARPSMGKSVMGLNIAQSAAMRGIRTAVFSLEMSRMQCHRRCLASLADIPHEWLLNPASADETLSARLVPAVRDMRAAPLLIDDTPSLNVRQFVSRAKRAHRAQPLELIVVDHIHDFSIDAKLARHEYGAIAQAGKKLAKDWNIPVVMLAQLNRNATGRTDKRPTLSDLRESGEIEQKGDLIIFLHREDYYDSPDHKTHLQGVVEAHIAKGRDIEAGKRITLRNRYDRMRLDDWEGELPSAPKSSSSRRGFTSRRTSPEGEW